MTAKRKVVIKLGGSALGDSRTLTQLAILVRGLRGEFYDVILVHGGGPAINREFVSRGIEWKFIRGQRQTTAEMMAVIERVLAFDVNSSICKSLRGLGIPAVGVSGAGNEILYCTQADPELGFVGNVQYVSSSKLEYVLRMKESPVPVVAPIGFGEGQVKFNVNADWAAAKIASAVQADQLLFLTDQEGILDQNKVLMKKASPRKLKMLIESGVISGGMRTKVLAMISALESGVEKVHVLSAASAGRLLTAPKIGSILSDEKQRNRNEREVLNGYAV